MNRRDRVKVALSHEQPDRVPLDFGGTLTTIHEAAYKELLRHLGMKEEKIEIVDVGMRMVSPSEAILRRFEIDFRHVYPGVLHRPVRTFPDGSYIDVWGVKRAPVGYYYDITSDGYPLKNVTDVGELGEYHWPQPLEAFEVDFEKIEKEAKYLHEQTDYAIVLAYSRMGSLFHTGTWDLMGFEGFFRALKINPKLASAVLDRVLDISVKALDETLGVVGKYLDVVCIGDDLGMQDRPLLSLDMYRKYIKPLHKKVIEVIRRKTDAKVFFHSDGSVSHYFDDLAEIGVDIVNPVQVSANNMDTKVLKERFGDRLSFWGGVDTQLVLPQGSPEDVRAEVKKRIRDLSPSGGYVLCAVHNIQPGVPPQNVCAMYEEAARK